MFLPEIKHNINWLSQINYRMVDNDFTYDKHSYAILDELFSVASAIAPDEHGARRFWIKADRGTVEHFHASYKAMLDSGEVGSWDEFVALWLDYFPDEYDWIPVCIIIDADYRAVFADYHMVLECDDRKPHKSFEHDISAFSQWLLDATREVIENIRVGIYNEQLEKELPSQRRTGTIHRRDMYRVFPEWKQNDYRDISTWELYEFIGAASRTDPIIPKTRMCANDFYNYCSLGYIANKYNVADMTPAEQYKRFADGRDEGLSKIDPDSYEAFEAWLNDRPRGGHPFEVCAGGNSTHIDLFVQHSDRGYWLVLRGHSEGRFIETIKFFLALQHARVPVVLQNARQLVARVVGDEEIGIVPEGVFPRYCESLFPEKEIISFMNLPFEKRSEFAALCKWQPIEFVHLLD